MGSEAPYTGPLGATRQEPAFVTGADGVARRVDVVRAVNASTDPALALAAIAGTLHRLDDGGELAVPFVFHDPGARRFVLVVPRTRAHEELALRAEYLVKMAADPTGPIPAYVREVRTVVGTDGLRRAIEEAADARGAEGRLEQVAHREERLRERAEEVTRREDELNHRIEELDAEKADLGVREQELEQRFADLVAREEALAGDERAVRANISALQARERLLESRERDANARERDANARELEMDARDQEAAAREQDLAAREHALEARATLVHDARETLPEPEPALETTRLPSTPPRAREPSDELEPIDAEELEAHEPDALEPESLEADEADDAPDHDAAPAVRAATDDGHSATESIEPEELSEHDVVASSGNTGVAPAPVAPTVEEPAAPAEPEVPPEVFANGQGAYVAVIDGEVRLWATGRPELSARLASGGATLLLQADPDSRLPLAVLAVITPDGESYARAVLDSTRPDDRAVLEALARDFRARFEVVSSSRRALGSYAVGAHGEPNAERVLAALAKREPGTDDARKAEADRLRANGVSSPEGDAFERALRDESAMATAAGAASVATAFEPLLDAAMRERLAMARGTPSARIDALGKRVVLAALRAGIVPSPALVRHAQTTGLVTDEKALVTRALTAYSRTCEAGPDAVGRSRTDALRAWDDLLRWAERVGAAVPDNAYAVMRSLFDIEDPEATPPPDPRPAPSPDAIGAMSEEELARWAEHPAARAMIAHEMLRRDPARFAPVLSRAVRLLAADAAVDLVAEMVRAGDALGDAWVELLGSRRPHAASMAAVATGAIHLRRGLNPVIQHALARDKHEWKLYGWAAGEFGAGALRAIGRLESFDADRAAWVLAHAIRAGAGRDVEKARSGPAGPLATAAATAIGRVDEAREYDSALRQGPGATDEEQLAHRILAKVGTRSGETVSTGAPDGV